MNQRIHDYLRSLRTNYPDACGAGASENQIRAAEKTLGLQLPEQYREFLSEFGAAIVNGVEVQGLEPPDWLDGRFRTFTDLSVHFRDTLGPDYKDFIAIGIDSSDNPIGFLPDEAIVFVYDHNFGGRHEIAKSFEEFLLMSIDGELAGSM